jgi:hypothetical protein
MDIFLDSFLLDQGVAGPIASDCCPHGQICDSQVVAHDKATQSEVIVQLVERIAQSLEVRRKEAFTFIYPFLNLISSVQQIIQDHVTGHEQKMHAGGCCCCRFCWLIQQDSEQLPSQTKSCHRRRSFGSPLC